jgi:hypothetical protein
LSVIASCHFSSGASMPSGTAAARAIDEYFDFSQRFQRVLRERLRRAFRQHIDRRDMRRRAARCDNFARELFKQLAPARGNAHAYAFGG